MALRALFSEYGSWLRNHREITAFPDSILRRGLQSLQREIASLPGAYGPPAGRLFLARVGDSVAGCGGCVQPAARQPN